MENILITGVAGYIGKKLAANLAAGKQAKKIIGIDIAQPFPMPEGLEFYRQDVREPIDDLLKKNSVDTVVHAAFVLPPCHDSSRAEDININGTKNIIESSIRSNVRHLLYTSSATAYGFHPDNKVPMTEDHSIRGNLDFTYSKSKRINEELIAQYLKQTLRMKITVLRPSFVVGPGFHNPLSEYLQRKIVILPKGAKPLQFVHEDDLFDIIMLMLKRNKGGIYNVGGDGEVSFRDMVSILGNISIDVPSIIAYPLNSIAWRLRLTALTKMPSSALNMARYSWVVSSEKLKHDTGFTYRYTSRQAFEDWVRAVKHN